VDASSGARVTLSNWHVCQGSKTGIMIAERDGDATRVHLKILDVYPLDDLCVLGPLDGPSIPIGETPSKFQKLFIVGHPYLRPLTGTEGNYIGLGPAPIIFPTEEDGTCLPGFMPAFRLFMSGCQRILTLGDTTIDIKPGNSGSPVVDARGRLVGVANSYSGVGASMIPLNRVKLVLARY
jgi:hypothetical protein